MPICQHCTNWTADEACAFCSARKLSDEKTIINYLKTGPIPWHLMVDAKEYQGIRLEIEMDKFEGHIIFTFRDINGKLLGEIRIGK